MKTNVSSISRQLKRFAVRLACSGRHYSCPICGRNFGRLLSTGEPLRRNARCPYCNSLERHRLLWRYLDEKTPFFQMAGARMLHVAAEECLESRWRPMIGAAYVTADLLQPADVKMDITDIHFPDDEFDIIYCSHVLEHVPDDRRAMREFHRVLKPGGFALLLVPITADMTVEDPSITDPAERLRLFGQDDHVRRYGPDYLDRLHEAGFAVTVTRAANFLSPQEIERLAIGTTAAGEIYHCTKSPG